MSQTIKPDNIKEMGREYVLCKVQKKKVQKGGVLSGFLKAERILKWETESWVTASNYNHKRVVQVGQKPTHKAGGVWI